jgi:spermidine/putrescine transport system substrate-binding protein
MYRLKRIYFIIFVVYLSLIIGGTYRSNIYSFQSDCKNNTNEDLSVLNIYTWSNFIDPEIFSDFEKEYHTKIHVDFYDDEEVMFSLVQSQPGLYDIIFPSDSLTDVMIKSNLLLKLQMKNIPNMRNLKEKFRIVTNEKWNGYSVPVDWGVTGIVYNTKYVKEPVESWNIFWNKNYMGRMAILNNGYDVMTIGQKRLGYSLNPENPEIMDESLKMLKTLKPLLQEEGFMSYNKIIEKMKDETLWIAQCYNGDAALITEENNRIRFVLPEEGTGFWMDNIAVPVGAKNKQLAEKFINFMLCPEISAKHTNYCYYANCNKKAARFVNKEILRNPYIYINKRKIENLELYKILNPEVQKKFNECWAKLQNF